MKKLPELIKLAGFGPKTVKRGICQEVVHTDEANLLTLPIIQCWPQDGDLVAEPPELGRGSEPAGTTTDDGNRPPAVSPHW